MRKNPFETAYGAPAGHVKGKQAPSPRGLPSGSEAGGATPPAAPGSGTGKNPFETAYGAPAGHVKNKQASSLRGPAAPQAPTGGVHAPTPYPGRSRAQFKDAEAANRFMRAHGVPESVLGGTYTREEWEAGKKSRKRLDRRWPEFTGHDAYEDYLNARAAWAVENYGKPAPPAPPPAGGETAGRNANERGQSYLSSHEKPWAEMSRDEMIRTAGNYRREAARLTALVTGRRVGTGEMAGLMARAADLNKKAVELDAERKRRREAEKAQAAQESAAAWQAAREKYSDFYVASAKKRRDEHAARAGEQTALGTAREGYDEYEDTFGFSFGTAKSLDDVEQQDVERAKSVRDQFTREQQAVAELDRNIAGAEYVQSWNAYDALTRKDDFARRSGVREEYADGDETYRWINNVGGFRDRTREAQHESLHERSGTGLSSDPQVRQRNEVYDEMSDYEVGIYNYLYRTQGKKKADEYLTWLGPDLYARQAAKAQAEMVEFGEEHPVIGSVASVPLNLAGGVVGAADTLYQVGRSALTGEKFDPYSRAQQFASAGRDIRGGASENMTDAGRFVYNTVMSGVDSWAAGAIMPGAGWAGALLATGAGADAARQAALQGGSNAQILASGVAAGIFEALFESWSIGNFQALKDVPVTGFKDFALNVAKEAGVNFSEEALTEIADIMADTVIMGDKSDRALRIRELMESGMSREEAERKVNGELALRVLEAGASGALMGAGFGAVGSAQSAYRDRGRAAGNETAAPGGTAENTRLTQNDLDAYLSVGERRHVRDTKTDQIAAGQSPILTSAREIAGFIRNALHGKIRDTVKGYGRVGARLANDVAGKSGGTVQIDGYYLELDANHIRHISDHVETDGDTRNIPLTEEQAEHLADYIDAYDDLLGVTSHKDGGVRIVFGKRINGHAIIVETVSKGRRALHPVTAYQMKTEEYERTYKAGTTADHNASYPEKSDQVDTSRQSVPADDIIPANRDSVNHGQYNAEAPPASPSKGAEATPGAHGAAPESVRQAQLRKAGQTLGEHGRKALMAAYRSGDGTPTDRYFAGFSVYYQAGLSGRDASRVRSAYGAALTGAQRLAAYSAGQNDAAASLAREKQAAGSVKGHAEPGFVNTAYSARLSRSTRRTLDRIGRALGVQIRMDAPTGAGGYNGRIDPDGTIHIAADAENPLAEVFKHEITHRMQQMAPEAYRKYRDFVMQVLGERYGDTLTMLRNTQARYAQGENGQTLSDEQAMDELAAQFAERMQAEPALFRRLAGQDYGTANRFLQAWRSTVDRIRRAFAGDRTAQREAADALGLQLEQMDEAARLWEAALKEAAEAVEQKSDKADASRENMLAEGEESGYTEDADVSITAAETAPKTKSSRKLKFGDTFPSHSKSDANTWAILWANSKDVKNGDTRLASYFNSWYLIEKDDDLALRYRIVRAIDKNKIDTLAGRFDDEHSYGRRSVQEASGEIDNFNRRSDPVGQGGSASDRVGTRQQGEDHGVQSVDREQAGRGETESDGSGDRAGSRTDRRMDPDAVRLRELSEQIKELEKKTKKAEKSVDHSKGINTAASNRAFRLRSELNAARREYNALWKVQDKLPTRFSMKSPVERSGDLLALHNLTEDKLLGALRLGGFPMPGIAVTKADIPHTHFGEITLVMDRRSFAAARGPVTLEGIAGAMAARNGGNRKSVSVFCGVKSLRSGMVRRFAGIIDMRVGEDRLRHLTEDQAQQINDALSDRLSAVMGRILDSRQTKRRSDDRFIDLDRIGQILMGVADGGKVTVDAIMKAFNGTGYRVAAPMAAEVRDLLFDVSRMPVNIFEAKPERAVGFDEVRAAVLPDNAGAEVRRGIETQGVDVLTYRAGDDADRLAKVNSVENVRFSKKDARSPEDAAGKNGLAEPGEAAYTETRYSRKNGYWRPQLTAKEWDVLNRAMDREIESGDQFLDRVTKWLYKDEKGTRVFAIYGIGDGTDPTPLYAVGGTQAVRDFEQLQRFLGGESIEGRPRILFARILGDLKSKQGHSGNGIRHDGYGSQENGDVRVLE